MTSSKRLRMRDYDIACARFLRKSRKYNKQAKIRRARFEQGGGGGPLLPKPHAFFASLFTERLHYCLGARSLEKAKYEVEFAQYSKKVDQSK